MELNEAVELIRHPKVSGGQDWVDLGSGSGLFSLALTEYLEQGSTISCIDTNQAALRRIPDMYNKVAIKKITADFVHDPWQVDRLDGILMANSFHFVKDKIAFLKKTSSYLKPVHSFLIVEYDTEKANQWVPYPIGFLSLKSLFEQAGYSSILRLHDMPSIFNRAKIYSTLIRR